MIIRKIKKTDLDRCAEIMTISYVSIAWTVTAGTVIVVDVAANTLPSGPDSPENFIELNVIGAIGGEANC